MCIRSLLSSVFIMNLICLWSVYQEFGYQCWVLVMKSRFMKLVVNVSSDLSSGGTSEMIRDLDAM